MSDACLFRPTCLVALPPTPPPRSLHHPAPCQELDPQAKFASEWDGWVWAATRDGASVPFASCCGPAGFSPACRLAPRTKC